MIVIQEDPNSLNELAFKAMNTDFFVEISNSTISNWKEHILGWFEYVDREWSRFNHDNELAQLNGLKIGQQISLSPPLFDVLQKADHYRMTTEGLFSPYLMNCLNYHGYNQTFPFVKAEVESRQDHSMVKGCPFKFDSEQSTVTRIANGQVELGGIGKGYAVESAMVWLKKFANAESGIVDGGGDISVWSGGIKEWKIGISDPFNPNKELRQISLKNGSIATSNIIYRSWQQGEQRKHHILNGKTGQPVNTEIIQATVITTNCLDAEVGAKLCFMEKGPKLIKLLEEINPNYKFVLVDRDRTLIIS
ncbi:FAD:protein FMN transferase [Bacillus sp. T3]|uniref:FAD:protein FMN transferase n=1 Tax=Bacillus sp. T3 TaxID=467262 RepID=UPI0029822ACC|nr:FAD:protein FMN transferase [Bacillus sp. T3]